MTMTKTPKYRRRTAAGREDRAAKMAAAFDRIEAVTGELDDEMRATVLARFAGYSDRNAMLIYSQIEERGMDVTDLDGFQTWKSRGRSVRKGERGIAILAPAGQREARDADPDAGTEAQPARRFFRLVYVFDISQTDIIADPNSNKD